MRLVACPGLFVRWNVTYSAMEAGNENSSIDLENRSTSVETLETAMQIGGS